jgi:hypothetical protein
MAVTQVDPFHERVSRNKRVNEWLKMRESAVFVVNTDKLSREILSIHATKKFRSVEGKAVLQSAQKVLVEANAENNANRSRLAEIKLQCFRSKRLINETIIEVTLYLRTRYVEELKREYKTIGDRDAAIHKVLEDFHRMIYKLDSVIGLADISIEDIDKSSYSIKGINDTLAITSKRENG